MGQIKKEQSSNDTQDIDLNYFERRLSARHQTTIIVKNPAREEEVSQRGDLNDKGFFFLPELNLVEGKELELEVRLPGLGEWVRCSGVVKSTLVRGASRGIVGHITETRGKSKEAMLLWRSLLKNRLPKAVSAISPFDWPSS